MPSCELCGNSDAHFTGIVEGTKLQLCTSCSKYASKALGITAQKSQKNQRASPEAETVLASDYPSVIKSAREKLGLEQMELAQEAGTSVNLIRKIETGDITPDDSLVHRIERILSIKLFVEIRTDYTQKNKESAGMTLGDHIKKDR